MKITFNNIRNVKHFSHEFKANKINVIYGPNGIGKTAIIKALATPEEELALHKSLYNWGEVSVITDKPRKINLFNEDTFSIDFVESNLVTNSFNLIFNTAEINEIKKEIERIIEVVTKITEEEAFVALEKRVNEFIKILRVKTDGTLVSTPTYKALDEYKPFTKRSISKNHYEIYTNIDQVAWLKWLSDVPPYKEELNRCPYCARMMTERINNTLTKIKETVTHNDLKNITALESNTTS